MTIKYQLTVNIMTITLILSGLLLVGLLIIEPSYLSAQSSLTTQPRQGQQNDSLKIANNNNTPIVPDFSNDTSRLQPKTVNNQFAISCNDFKTLFDTLGALNIGDAVTKGDINQSKLDSVEDVFNNYAGNCPELDEYEFE